MQSKEFPVRNSEHGQLGLLLPATIVVVNLTLARVLADDADLAQEHAQSDVKTEAAACGELKVSWSATLVPRPRFGIAHPACFLRGGDEELGISDGSTIIVTPSAAEVCADEWRVMTGPNRETLYAA